MVPAIAYRDVSLAPSEVAILEEQVLVLKLVDLAYQVHSVD